MEILITAFQFILALSILITLHEFGHYWAARAFGIRIEKFFLFFDAWNIKLFSFKKGDTEYGMGWLPLGGYVKIAGMMDESLDTEQMKSEPQPWEFRSKPAWQRLIVMVGGVTVNLILGIILMVSLTYSQGESYIPNEAINNKASKTTKAGPRGGISKRIQEIRICMCIYMILRDAYFIAQKFIDIEPLRKNTDGPCNSGRLGHNRIRPHRHVITT